MINDQVQRMVDSIHFVGRENDPIYKALEEIDRQETEKRDFKWMENYILPEKRKEMYLDYENNFLTVSRFAEYYNISEKQAHSIIDEFRNKKVI